MAANEEACLRKFRALRLLNDRSANGGRRSFQRTRAAMGPDATLGVTCEGSRDLAIAAGEDGADYVAFGAFFPSGTKEVTRFIDPEILHWWSELMELPRCAIGGITAESCAAGAGRRRFSCGGRRSLEPSRWPCRGRARAARRDCRGAMTCWRVGV
jgi:hypothetical protein